MAFDCYAYGNIKVSKIPPIGNSSSEGHYQKKGSKVETDYPDPVCAECRVNIFDILINGEAISVTLPKTVGGKNLGLKTFQKFKKQFKMSWISLRK